MEDSGEATGMELIDGKGLGESDRKWVGEGAASTEEEGRGSERMGWKEGTGCQRRVRDPERACGIQGIESWKGWEGNQP